MTFGPEEDDEDLDSFWSRMLEPDDAYSYEDFC